MEQSIKFTLCLNLFSTSHKRSQPSTLFFGKEKVGTECGSVLRATLTGSALPRYIYVYPKDITGLTQRRISTGMCTSTDGPKTESTCPHIEKNQQNKLLKSVE